MRLTHEQVKRGILHSEQLVRDAALRYFADSFSPDTAIMPLAIELIRTRGWRDAFGLDNRYANLAQTEETIVWAIDQLNRLGRPKAHEDLVRCDWLAHIIANADVMLLMKFEERALGLEALDGGARDAIAERLRLTTLDTDSCWGELEKFCEENQGGQSRGADDRHARRLVEAIARDEASERRVLSILGQHGAASGLMPRFAVGAAGMMRLEAAVPAIVARLKSKAGDGVADDSSEALARIGSDTTVAAMCESFAAAPGHYRLAVAAALGRVRSDLAVAKCAELVDQEKNDEIKTALAGSLLLNFSVEGVAPARQLTLRGITDVRRSLVAAATLMDVSFPEFEDWKKDELRRDADARRTRGWESAVGTAKGKSMPAPGGKPMQSTPTSPIVSKPKVGRNDPCPCGSGKKYKKCCG